VYYGGSYEIITLSREHNNANVLSLGARFLSTDEARKVVELWLKTSFSEDERHKRRIRKIDAYV
jgi:ribose 5-phosphate isomerase B